MESGPRMNGGGTMSDFPPAIVEIVKEMDERLADEGVRIVALFVYHENKMALTFTPNLTPESKHAAMIRAAEILRKFIASEAV